VPPLPLIEGRGVPARGVFTPPLLLLLSPFPGGGGVGLVAPSAVSGDAYLMLSPAMSAGSFIMALLSGPGNSRSTI
jgi:hypothetical protein